MGVPTFRNTLTLAAPHKVFSAIGISFYSCAYFEDFDHDPRFEGPFPPAVLTVAAAGGQFVSEDQSIVTIKVSALDKIGVTLGP